MIIDLKKVKENLFSELQQITKSLRKISQEEQSLNELLDLESRLQVLTSDIVRSLFRESLY